MLSQRALNIEESATLASTQKARELKASGVDIISLTIGEPDFQTPQHIKQAAITAIQQGLSDHYTNATGIVELKKAIVNFHKEHDNMNYLPKQVVVGTGAKHILYVLCQTILNPNDKVIIPTPYWVSYSQQVKLAGGIPVFVETTMATQYKLTVDQLNGLDVSGVKALIINSPTNPTGSVYTKDELRVIAEWAIAHGIYIIADEMYNQLVYGEMESFSIGSLSDDIKKNTIVVNGFSKAYAMTGWRVGYALCENEDIVHGMSQLISHETSNLTAVSQYAAIAAYTHSQQVVEDMRAVFEQRLNTFYELISQIDGFELQKPQGAFYLFPNVKQAAQHCGFNSVEEFCNALLEKAHVAVVPGVAFGAPDCMRLSYAGDTKDLVSAAQRIKAFVDKNRI